MEWLRSNKADIIVMDMIMLPGIDGLEAYKMILESNPQQEFDNREVRFFQSLTMPACSRFPV